MSRPGLITRPALSRASAQHGSTGVEHRFVAVHEHPPDGLPELLDREASDLCPDPVQEGNAGLVVFAGRYPLP